MRIVGATDPVPVKANDVEVVGRDDESFPEKGAVGPGPDAGRARANHVWDLPPGVQEAGCHGGGEQEHREDAKPAHG